MTLLILALFGVSLVGCAVLIGQMRRTDKVWAEAGGKTSGAEAAVLAFAWVFSCGVLMGCVHVLRLPLLHVRMRWAAFIGVALSGVAVAGGLVVAFWRVGG